MNSSAGLDAAAPFSTSTGLIERAKAHDPAAWQRLSSLYTPVVYRWSRGSGLQPSDAADVAQNVFTAVWHNLAAFRKESPQDSFRGWLWTITRNKIRDHFRNAAASPVAQGGSAAHEQLAQAAEAAAEDSAEPAPADTHLLLVHRAMELVRVEFKPQSWQAFWQTAVEGRRPADVAADLGMSVAAVYKAKSRVLHRLRQELTGLTD